MNKRILAAGTLAALCGLAGCVNEPTITNPYEPSGPKITEDQLIRLTVAEEEKIKRQAEESAQEAADDLDKEKSAYDLAVADLEAEMQSRLRQLNADLAADTRAAESATRRAASMMNSALAQTRRLHEDGIAAIERAWAQRTMIGAVSKQAIEAVSPFAVAVPGGVAAISIIGNLLQGWAGASRRRRSEAEIAAERIEKERAVREAADRAWAEAHAEKEKEIERRDAAWTESQGEAIKMLLATGGGSLASLLNKAPHPTTEGAKNGPV